MPFLFTMCFDSQLLLTLVIRRTLHSIMELTVGHSSCWPLYKQTNSHTHTSHLGPILGNDWGRDGGGGCRIRNGSLFCSDLLPSELHHRKLLKCIVDQWLCVWFTTDLAISHRQSNQRTNMPVDIVSSV